MKTLTELKEGDKIYDIDFRQIKWYTYLCIHPTGQGKYHILIDSFEEPIRIHGEKLQTILNQDFKTYQDAKLALANRLEESAKRLRDEADKYINAKLYKIPDNF
jgi:hypothetical protein